MRRNTNSANCKNNEIKKAQGSFKAGERGVESKRKTRGREKQIPAMQIIIVCGENKVKYKFR